MAIAELSRVFDHFANAINRLDPFGKRCYRFGPRSVVGCLALLCAKCLADSYDEALEAAHERWGPAFGWGEPPSKGALSKARERTDPAVCWKLWQEQLVLGHDIIEANIHSLPERRRYLAMDGTWMLVPDSGDVRVEWHQGEKPSSIQPQVLMVTAVEITQRLPVACAIVGLDTGERDAATTLLHQLDLSDVLLFDRGYPGREFLGAIIDCSMDFAVRMVVGAGAFPEVDAFWKTGQDEAVVPVHFGSHGIHRVRMVRRQPTAGWPSDGQPLENMVVMTTLLDSVTYPLATILDLYKARWEVETFYREAKVAIGIEMFHSTKPRGIQQEIYLVMAWMTIYALVAHEADCRLRDVHGHQAWNDPERYTINRAQVARAIRRLAPALIHMSLVIRAQAVHCLDKTLDRLVRQAQRRRPNRIHKRERKRPFGRFTTDNKRRKRK
jgi:hypothetical protein